ncbi:MAG: type IV pilus assembly protein PilM [Phycisphaerae bacterium]|nr:type IV pilus assembly protein PilM [Phycisphaerae bacterium]
MAANKPVWGIDLGQCALKAIRVRAAGDKVEVLDHVYIEHSKILSQPEVNKAALIAESMKKFLDAHDLANERIVVAVPGQHTLARFTKLPPIDNKKRIPDLVKYEAQQQIPFDMEEVIWDYQIFEDPEAAETEVGIFAMRRELMREYLRFLSDLNFEPAIVQSSPLALYNALRYDGLCGQESVAILDIGAQNTDLLVVDGNSLWTRNIPIGGNNFTEALLKTFKLSFSKAENLKRSASSSKYARQIFQAMRPVFADLVAEVQRSIGFFTSSRRGVKLNKLLAMGNAFKLPGMPKFIQQNMGMEVVRPSTFNRLSASNAPNAPQLMDQLLSFGIAYGLAVQGLDQAPITSNLLPPEIAKQVIWRKKTPWFYGAAACLLLAAGLVWTVNLSEQRALATATGKGLPAPMRPQDPQAASAILTRGPDASQPPKFYAQQILDAVQVLQDEKSRIESENQEQIGKAQEIERLQAHKVIWPRILDMIHSAMPARDPELINAMAKGPQPYKDLIESNPDKYERSKRAQVFIQSMDAVYSSDVLSVYESMKSPGGTTSGGRMSRMDAGDAPDQPQISGFVISMVGRTPFAGGDQIRGTAFVNDTFIAGLRQAGQGQKGLYFDKMFLVRCVPVRDLGGGGGRAPTGLRGGLPGPTSFAGPRRSSSPGIGGPGPDGGIATIANLGEDKDPVTGESILRDWEFEIVFVAILGDRPAADGSLNAEPPAESLDEIPIQ